MNIFRRVMCRQQKAGQNESNAKYLDSNACARGREIMEELIKKEIKK